MKNKLVIVFVIGFAFSAANFVQAQSIKKYSGTKRVDLPGRIYRSLDCQENYDYYIGDDGSYIKSGNYSLKGSANQIVGSVNVTYSVNATYKNDLLNGHFSARITIKGRGEYRAVFHDWEQYNVDYTLSANFKDGVPDGQWIFTEIGLMDKSTYKTTFNCRNGMFVGDFNCNLGDFEYPEHMSGTFDQNGNLLSLNLYNSQEYKLNSDRDLLSYFLRDANNKTVKRIQCNEVLLKEYQEQINSSVRSFINEKGYYLTKSSSRESIKFSTQDILDYIWRSMLFQNTIDGTKRSAGFFSSYSYYISDIQKTPAKQLTETQLSELLDKIKRKLNNKYSTYDESMSKDSVFSQCQNDFLIFCDNHVELIIINDTVFYFDDSQSAHFKESVFQIWDEALENKRKEKERQLQKAKTELANNAKSEITKIMEELVSWPMDAYKEQYKTNGTQTEPVGVILVRYYDNYPERAKIWEGFGNTYRTDKNENVKAAMKKFEKFHKVVSYNIEGVRVSDNADVCVVFLTVNKKNSDSYGYKTYKTEASFSTSWLSYDLDVGNSFEKMEYIPNMWDTVNALVDTSSELNNQLKSYENSYNTVYKSYLQLDNSLKGDKDDPQNQYEYWLITIDIQKGYLRFIDLVKQIDEISESTALNAKDKSDIAKSYQNVKKTWSMDASGEIADEVKRLEGYRNIQDSCLLFIELRKTITQNNTNIAGYAKTAPTIVKAYNTYMKGVDLTWTPELGRNQAVREIINTQNALINELSKPNIGEIDKSAKKSKAKTWRDVKKIVFQ